MRTSIGLLVLVASTTLAAPLRGNGKIRTESRKVSEFSSVSVSGGLEVAIHEGSTPTLVIAGDDNLLEFVRTEVVGHELVIKPAHAELRPTKRLVVTLTASRLKRLDASGGVDVALESTVDAMSFRIDASGGVDLRALSLDSEVVQAEVSGGVKMRLGGRAKRVKFDVSGGVDLNAADLEAAQVELDASGGCELQVHATESISGDASAGVNVRVAGRPKGKVHTSAGADVDYLN